MLESRSRDCTVPPDGSGEPARAWSPAWDIRSLRIPAMASSQGDVRPSPMAYPASGAATAKESPNDSRYLTARQHTDPTSQFEYVFGQNVAEHNPAPSPSGHPLLSGHKTAPGVFTKSPTLVGHCAPKPGSTDRLLISPSGAEGPATDRLSARGNCYAPFAGKLPAGVKKGEED